MATDTRLARPNQPAAAAAAGGAHRPQLDGIRAIAVGLVVVFHLGFGWVPGGFTGVDVFFVLSGYLISGLLLAEAAGEGRVRLARFYARRARRLLPAAWAVVIFSVLTSRHVSSPIDYPHLRRHAMSAVLYVANWDAASVDTGYFATDTNPSPLIHFWSLAVEEQFYFIWPALVLGCLWLARRAGRRIDDVLLVVFGGVTLVSVALALALTPSTAAYYGSHTRAFELAAGGLLAVAMYRRRRREIDTTTHRVNRLATTLGAAGVAGTVGLALTINGGDNYPGWSAVWVTAASVLLIAGADLSNTSPAARALGNPVFAWIGRLSYSIYLWHWPLIVFFADDLPKPVLVAAILAASQASYTLIEQPVRRRSLPRAPYPAVVAVGLTGSALLGLLLVPAYLANSATEEKLIEAVEHQEVQVTCLSTAKTKSNESCVVHIGTGPTVAIVGDSHATQWIPALANLAEQGNWTLIKTTHIGCPANDSVLADHHRAVACRAWRHHALPGLVESFDPDFVVVATRSYRSALQTPEGVLRVGSPEHANVWRESWEWTIRALSAGGAHVAIMQTLPTMPMEITDCIAEHPDQTSECDFPLSVDADLPPYTAAVERLGREHPNVTILDPLPFICPDQECPAMIEGLQVHIDTDHLNRQFVAAHTRDLATLLARMGLH